MECPKCGHVQADGPAECAKCGLLFIKWVERRSKGLRPPRPAPPRPRPNEDDGASKASPLGLLLGGTATLFLGLAAWHFWLAGGLPVDPDAYRDPGNEFAIALPPGWSLVTPATSEAVLETDPNGCPDAVEQAVRDGRAAAAFYLPGAPGALAPWGTVTAVEGIPPPLRTQDEPTLAAVSAAALSAGYAEYRLRRASVERIDRLPALRVEGTDEVRYLKSPSQEVFGELPGGGRYPLGKTEDIWDSFVRALDHRLIPARDRSFVLAFGCPEETRSLHAPAFDRMADSFRILDRPPLYGYTATPALRTAATVLLGAVLLYTLTEAAAFLRK